jgi:predicted Rossmann fold nucleotide-binding protein DprA/Smf involved in DNA uptake
VLSRLSDHPVHPDALAAATRLAPQALAVQLAELELAGLVRTLPGGLVVRDPGGRGRAHTRPAGAAIEGD